MQINGVRFEQLNSIQKRILYEMDKRDRLAVIGGPGTGKTFIAVFAILKALQENKDSFFLVYNKNLNLYIKKLIGKESFPEYLAKTYHSWLPSYLSQVLDNYPIPRIRDELMIRGETFDYRWGEITKLLQNVHPNKKRKYDFLFVDEAQDMPLPLIDILKGASKKLMVTFDDSQKIGTDYFKAQKDQQFDRTEILTRLDLADSFFDLTQNYRNTQPVERVAKLFGQYFKPNAFTLRQETSPLKGPLPFLIKTKDALQRARLIVQMFLQQQNLQIGILFANTRQKEDTEKIVQFKTYLLQELGALSPFLFYKLENETMIQSFDAPGIYLMSMNSSKGLEFDHVFIIETEWLKLENDHQANLVYVACTRSRFGLTFLYENHAAGCLALAFEHPLLFNALDASKNQTQEEDLTILSMMRELEHE